MNTQEKKTKAQEIFDEMTKGGYSVKQHPMYQNVTELYAGEHEIGQIYAVNIGTNITNRESQINAAAIRNAVNNTWMKGINPEGVPEMLEALKRIIANWSIHPDGLNELKKEIQSVLEKATIK